MMRKPRMNESTRKGWNSNRVGIGVITVRSNFENIDRHIVLVLNGGHSRVQFSPWNTEWSLPFARS
eukprot:2152801-Amphidinium_carterae.1